MSKGYELYVISMPRGIRRCVERDFASWVYSHLVETGRIERCFSLESDLVRGWLNDPSSYPDELKGKWVVLWGSQRGTSDDREVAILRWIWNFNEVYVDWGDFGDGGPYSYKGNWVSDDCAALLIPEVSRE